MQPIKVVFEYCGTSSSKDKSDTSIRIYHLLCNTFNENQHIDFDSFINNEQNRKKIEFCLCADKLDIFNFDKANILSFDVKIEQEQRFEMPEYDWKMAYILTSTEHICIDIKNENTITCYEIGENKEIIFISLKDTGLTMRVAD